MSCDRCPSDSVGRGHTPTLPHTPLQLGEDVHQQDLAQGLVELREHVADGVQRMVACGRHPLRFLEEGEEHQAQSRGRGVRQRDL